MIGHLVAQRPSYKNLNRRIGLIPIPMYDLVADTKGATNVTTLGE
jgi:hypothetical protein